MNKDEYNRKWTQFTGSVQERDRIAQDRIETQVDEWMNKHAN